MRSAIVLGGGMVGISSAVHLQRRGWSVTLIDRKDPGQETSYGNAGVIQGEAVRPYAMPRDLRTLAKIAFGRTNDVHYRLLSLPAHVRPLLRYWWHSAPDRHRAISQSWAPLIAASIAEHDDLIRAAGADNLIRRGGFRILHRDQSALDAAIADAESDARDFGVKFSVMSGGELARAEPVESEALPGAIHWLDPWTVSDPGGLVAAYADLFRSLGGTVLRGDAASLKQASGGWSVETADGRVDAASAVIALGPWSSDFLKQFGYRIPLVRKRGHHAHYHTARSLDLPLMDAGFGYVMAPMAKGLRITTGAELTHPDAPPASAQLDTAEAAARQLVAFGSRIEATPWAGTRPCSPDMLPVLGSAPRHRGLWMNFGHGHQGFTLGPVTGRLLAEQMSGETPHTPAAAYSPQRFDRI